jgi:hypothetical protein
VVFNAYLNAGLWVSASELTVAVLIVAVPLVTTRKVR